jgi:hypothetical protein
MIKKERIARTPREHFMRAVDDELAKFERKEMAFQQAEREERASRLRLPLARAKIRHRDATSACSARSRPGLEVPPPGPQGPLPPTCAPIAETSGTVWSCFRDPLSRDPAKLLRAFMKQVLASDAMEWAADEMSSPTFREGDASTQRPT